MSLPLEITATDVKTRLDAGEKVALIDVREPFEHAICSITAAELIPMNSVPARLQDIEAKSDAAERVVVLCHHGMRSLNVVNWLRGQGIENCQSLSGGIDAWSLSVDRAVPRY